ncbi:hypothetical protein ABEB36_000252 [Hypothenemus hampei]|uniref:Uncharacterized protein n=1 Tax=Hypothenemus hampei TaxID=57062 RepID=A0ABD1DZU1_HYPHA
MGNSDSKKAETSNTGVVNNEFRVCPPANPLEDHIVPLLYILLGAAVAFATVKAYHIHRKRLKRRSPRTNTMEQQNGKRKAGGQLSRGGNICHDKDTSPLRTSTHNLKPPSPVLTRVTTIVRVNQNKRPTDQNKKSGDPNPSKQSWGTIPNSEYSFDRGENPSPRRESNRRRCYVILITRPAVVRTTNIVIVI